MRRYTGPVLGRAVAAVPPGLLAVSPGQSFAVFCATIGFLALLIFILALCDRVPVYERSRRNSSFRLTISKIHPRRTQRPEANDGD